MEERQFKDHDLDRSWVYGELAALSEEEITKLAFLRDCKNLVFFMPATGILYYLASRLGSVGVVMGWLGALLFGICAAQHMCAAGLGVVSLFGKLRFETESRAKKFLWTFLALLNSVVNFIAYSGMVYAAYLGTRR